MKSEIIKAMMADSQSAHMSKASAESAFDTVFRAVKTVVERDKQARVPGFGTFNMKFREGRTGRNPSTGEPVQISARNVLTFKQATTSK